MYSVMGLLAQNGSINEGEIVFNGESIARRIFLIIVPMRKKCVRFVEIQWQ
mgnify:FL=1